MKHFAGYGASLAGRDYNIQDISERELREVHLPPFQAAIDVGVASLMCAYTMYDGEPLTINDYLLKNVLRNEMGFSGLVMTDWQTIPNMVKIGLCTDNIEATEKAIKSGIDMDMTSSEFIKNLPELVRQGKVDEKLVDAAVRRVIQLKDDLGLLDDPYRYFNRKTEREELLSEQNKNLAKDIARKSMVLLKNEGVLPIRNKQIKRIAVIGPMIDARRDMLGWWEAKGVSAEVKTIREAIQEQLGDDYELMFAHGCEIDSFYIAGQELIPQAVKAAKHADAVILALGENYWMSGEGGGVASLDLPGAQLELLHAVSKVGKPIISVIITGRPYILTEVAQESDALLQAWMPGTMGADAIVDIITGEFNPCGKLPITFPLHQGQVPIHYNYKRSSHSFEGLPSGDRYTTTYRDVDSKPLYPFGYGLSYTKFEYSDINLSNDEMGIDGYITAKIDVTNTGEMQGREIVQLYIGDVVCSVVRPFIELKDFLVVDLKPGERRTVEFKIDTQKLNFISKNYERIVEKGDFKVFIGGNSVDLKEAHFMLR